MTGHRFCPKYIDSRMKKMGAAKFKEQCLSILDNLDVEGLVVTKHGRPVARVFRYEEAPGERIGSLKNKIRIVKEIESTGLRWDAES